MAFDELNDEQVVRLIYRKQHGEYLRRGAAERNRALAFAKRCVNHDAAFLPLVRQISAAEYKELVAGVKQRGHALQRFLAELNGGADSFSFAGIIPPSQFARIRARYNISRAHPGFRPENFQFWYAPDIIRDHAGSFRVIEDNVGFVGGIGDLEELANAVSAFGLPCSSALHPKHFYRSMRERYEREAALSGGGKVILLSYSQSQRANHEDTRLAHALGKSVIHVTNFRTIKVRANGVYHLGERVGFVIINLDAEDIEPATPSPYRISHFWRAVSLGQVGVSAVPGLELIGDKRLYGYVEALVKHYSGEACRLSSIPILDLKNSASFANVRNSRERWVIKACRSQGGKSVWVGPHMKQKNWESLLRRISKRADSFIAQKYVQPSQFLGRDVDLRPLALIFPDEEIVSPILWGRAAKGKKAKTNIAQGGLLAPTLVT